MTLQIITTTIVIVIVIIIIIIIIYRRSTLLGLVFLQHCCSTVLIHHICTVWMVHVCHVMDGTCIYYTFTGVSDTDFAMHRSSHLEAAFANPSTC